MFAFNYIVTTRIEHVPEDAQIFMVDGTVPNWTAAARSLLGSPSASRWTYSNGGHASITTSHTFARKSVLGKLACIVTMQLDADACVAAAGLQLTESELGSRAGDVMRRLRAIAFDCDHFGVPHDLADLAANAVASIALQLPSASD